jgi:ABC-type transport system involved in multi-copper enzyme maturation permease subunit
MLTTYLKGLKKNWLIGIIPPAFVVLFIPIIAAIWPELEAQADAFAAILENEIYKVMLGDLAEGMFTSWQGIIIMYIFVWIDFIMIFITIFMPVRILTSEVDKGTLDVTLSYPIPRWKYLLEKYSVYLTYQMLYPILVGSILILSTELMGEEIDPSAVFLALSGVTLKFFALGSLTFLCAVIFLKTNRAMAAAAGVVLGSYIGERIGMLVASAGGTSATIGNFVANLSMFHYLTAGNIQRWVTGTWEALFENLIPELIIVVGTGLAALILALYIFENRELAY